MRTVGTAQITPSLPNKKGSLEEGLFFIFAIEAGLGSAKQVNKTRQRFGRTKCAPQG